jgi:type II secretory pathway pseudopilin PulG
LNKWVQKARLAASDEAGLTLIETLMALLVFLLIFLALLTSTIAGFTAVRQTRFVQQASALANESIEAARDMSYDAVILVSSDTTWTGDPYASTTCAPNFSGVRSHDPDGSGPLACERIAEGATGSFNPHRATRTIDGKQFTVNRYVTWVDDATQGGTGQSYKRFSVVVEWEHNGTKRYRASTLISPARRGPPQPEFTLTPGTQSAGFVDTGTNSYVAFAHTIKNYGVADTYELSIDEFDLDDPPLGSPWSYTMYRDEGTIGQWDVEGAVEELNDDDGNGTLETDPVAAAPNTTTPTDYHFLVVITYDSTSSAPSTEFTVRATSRLDPDVTTTASDNAAGLLNLFLHNRTSGNDSPSGDTEANANMLMSTTASSTSTLYNYSTDLSSGTFGRYVGVVGSASAGANPSNPPNNLINWTYQVPGPNPLTLSGNNVVLRLWWTTPSCGGVFRVNVFLNHKASRTTSTVTNIGSRTQNVLTTASCDFEHPAQRLQVSIPVTAGTQIPVNRWLEVKVQITDNNTSDLIPPSPVLFMYDTSSSTCTGVVQTVCYRGRLQVPLT